MAVTDENAEARLAEVRHIAEAKGGKLISSTYKNAHTKLEFEDAAGNRFFISRANVCRGKWSPYESRCVRDPSWHLKELSRIARSKGGRLVSDIYQGAFAKLEFEDSAGRRFQMAPTNVKAGRWSPYESGTVRTDPEWHLSELRSIAEGRGGSLVSPTYHGSQHPLVFRDAAGNRFLMRPSSVKRGAWSPYEAGNVTDPEWHIRVLRQIAETRGGRLISDAYEGKDTPLEFEDAAGRRFCSAPNNVKRGTWSPYEAGNAHDPSWHLEELKRIAELRGGRLVSATYVSSRSPMEFEDAGGLRFISTSSAVKRGTWSPHEGRIGEEVCRQIFNFIFDADFRPSWRVIRLPNGRPLQLDGYADAALVKGNPLKIAFEYQGFHHFVEAFGADLERIRERDQHKREECLRLGILLVEVTEFPGEWQFQSANVYLHVQRAIAAAFARHRRACPDFPPAFEADLSVVHRAVRHINELRSIAQAKGGKLVSTVWMGLATKLVFEDAAGRRFEMLPGTVKRGSWSPYEANQVRDPAFHLTELSRLAAMRGGRLIGSSYKGAHIHLEFEDVTGKRFYMRPTTVKRGGWSPFETTAQGARVLDTPTERRVVTANGHLIRYRRDADTPLQIAEHQHPGGLERRVWHPSGGTILIVRSRRATPAECFKVHAVEHEDGSPVRLLDDKTHRGEARPAVRKRP